MVAMSNFARDSIETMARLATKLSPGLGSDW